MGGGTGGGSGGENLADPFIFLRTALLSGLESSIAEVQGQAEDTLRTNGRFLLNMCDYQDLLTPDLTQAFPEALQRFFESLPGWMTFDSMLAEEDVFQELPLEVQAAVRPHLYNPLKKLRPS